MNNNPLISVIIPTFNRENLVLRAVRSILNQTYGNFEIIIIDDASTDCTEEKVKQIRDDRIKYFKNDKNLGVSGARNKGIKLSSGEIIALQDSDDEAYPERLEKQLRVLLNSGEDTAAVYCGVEYYDSNTGQKIREKFREVDFRENFTKGSYLLTPSTGTLLIKKAVFEEVGWFDEKMRAHVDTELGIRVSKKYRYAAVSEFLVKVYHYHAQIKSNAADYIFAKEIIFEKHRDYLSKKILFGLCKMISNYYILSKDHKKAAKYIKESLKYNFDLKTFFQYLGILCFPFLIKKLWHIRFGDEIPLTSGLTPKKT